MYHLSSHCFASPLPIILDPSVGVRRIPTMMWGSCVLHLWQSDYTYIKISEKMILYMCSVVLFPRPRPVKSGFSQAMVLNLKMVQLIHDSALRASRLPAGDSLPGRRSAAQLVSTPLPAYCAAANAPPGGRPRHYNMSVLYIFLYLER